MEGFSIRRAEEKDCGLILYFIKALAAYEKMSDEVVATEELLREWLFEKRSAEVLFACENGREVGFALFFHNFSTFVGRAGLYLEDLYVLPEYRGKGYGKALLRRLAANAAADVWNGFASTGTGQAWTFTARSARFRWTNGRSGVSRGRR